MRVELIVFGVGDGAMRVRRCPRLSLLAQTASVAIAYSCTVWPPAARLPRSFARTCSRRAACHSLTDERGTVGRMRAGCARAAAASRGAMADARRREAPASPMYLFPTNLSHFDASRATQ